MKDGDLYPFKSNHITRNSEPGKYYTMFLAILTMFTALAISAVAIYYSVAGLVAIFAAAAIPIMIMGGTLEIAKLVTAVWLHRYWNKATWWLKYYLATAVLVLMFITSMGIFGYLSKAHIEQTSASEESIAQVTQINTEISRLNAVIVRSEEKIKALETSGTGSDANLQAQIDKEQERIDKAFERIQPAIDQQNKIIQDARATDATRTKPYEDQLSNIQAEIIRLETSAKEYEGTIAGLKVDNSAVQPLLDQIASIEATISKVEGQIASGEREQIKQAQQTAGANADGSVGPRTRAAINTWIEQQKLRISSLNNEISRLREEAIVSLDAERDRLSNVVKDIRTSLIPNLKERELVMLGKIDEVRQTESPVIQTARDEIQRLRESAEAQVVNSQKLIERLRDQLAQTDKAEEIDAAIDEQLGRIKKAESELDVLTEEKYKLEGEYRKLEAEVGPIKYIAEFVYGEAADNTMLEEAVRWVILIIIFVFDPLAVLLLIASQYTFDFARDKRKENDWRDYETARGNKIAQNKGPSEGEKDEDIQTSDSVDDVPASSDHKEEEQTDTEQPEQTSEEIKYEDVDKETLDKEFEEEDISEEDLKKLLGEEEPNEVEKKDTKSSEESSSEVLEEDQLSAEEQARKDDYETKDATAEFRNARQEWKSRHPNETLKQYKNWYIKGIIDTLPWEEQSPKAYIKQDADGDQIRIKPDLTEVIEPTGYEQNAEQNENTIFNKLKK